MLSAISSNMEKTKMLLSGNGLILYHIIPTFNDPKKEDFEKIVGKETVPGQHRKDEHFTETCGSPFQTKEGGENKTKIKGLKVLKVALMERPWYSGTDRWSSPLYMTILLLCNWDSFGKQSWKKEKLIFFFTQGFLPIRLKFNGSSHIWLVFSNLTSLQFSWANAVTCNWQLLTELDLFIFGVDIQPDIIYLKQY